MGEPQKIDVVGGLRALARNFRRNAEGSTDPKQQENFRAGAMIMDAGADEIERLRKLEPQSSTAVARGEN